MSALTVIREALAAAIDVTDLTVYSYYPANAELPCAVLGMPESVEYHADLGGGITAVMPLTLIAYSGDDEETERQLEAFASPDGPLVQSLEAATGPFRFLVTEARGFGQYSIAGNDYLGCQLLIAISA